MKFLLGAVLSLLFLITAQSQNLIKNGSFEDTRLDCVDYISNFDSAVISWSTPTIGSTDVFNECNDGKVGVPVNFKGFQKAQNGQNYAGCFLYAPRDFREYLQTSLDSPLMVGKKYTFSFYLSLSGDSQFFLNTIGIVLADQILDVNLETILTNKVLDQNLDNYSLCVADAMPLDDKKSWMRVEIDFIAKGYEKHIIIGNFELKKHSSLKRISKTRTKHTSAYYYIDNVSLFPTEKTAAITLETLSLDEKEGDKETQFVTDKVYRLKNVHFEHDKFDISKEAAIELEDIVQYLNANPDIGLHIIGHTDRSGTTTYNLDLSNKRANGIAEYIINKGISQTRVRAEGKGETQARGTTYGNEISQVYRKVEFFFMTLD